MQRLLKGFFVACETTRNKALKSTASSLQRVKVANAKTRRQTDIILRFSNGASNRSISRFEKIVDDDMASLSCSRQQVTDTSTEQIPSECSYASITTYLSYYWKTM